MGLKSRKRPDAPATRADLEGLRKATRADLDESVARIDQRFAGHDRRFDELDHKIETLRKDVVVQMAQASEHTARIVTENLSLELARHTRSITEHVSAQVRMVDEKYSHLPDLVKQ